MFCSAGFCFRHLVASPHFTVSLKTAILCISPFYTCGAAGKNCAGGKKFFFKKHTFKKTKASKTLKRQLKNNSRKLKILQ